MAALIPLLLLLWPPNPALGNEGAAAGSCKCRREVEEPPIVKHFPRKLQCCQTCPDHMLRFKFPKIAVCGHKTIPWTREFWNSSCNTAPVCFPEDEGSRPAMRAEGSRPPQVPTPATIPTETAAPGPVRGIPEETPRAQLTPGRTTGAPGAQGRAKSTPPTPEEPAGAGPSRLPLQEETGAPPAVAGGSRVAVLALTGVALASAAVAVLVVCQRRSWVRRIPLPHRSLPPGETVRYLPCTET